MYFMFGLESGKNGWNGFFFVFDKVRIGMDDRRRFRCDSFFDIFVCEGCFMVEMLCVEYDWYVVGLQFIMYMVGRVLEKLGLEFIFVDIKGYEMLLKLVENIVGDSFDFYYGLFLYNFNVMEQFERFGFVFELLKKQFFG